MLDLNEYIGPMPPPAFALQRDIVSEALPAIDPPRRIDVPTWAEQERKLVTPTYTGPWDNDFAPYMKEPSRLTTSRRFPGVTFCGPARTGKSDSLILNTLGHRICCNPRDMMITCPTQTAAGLFSKRKIDPVIRTNAVIRDRQMSGRGADNIYDKMFRGNMTLHMGHPVPAEFAMLEYADVLLTDLDRMPDDIGDEGAPFFLALKRIQSYGSLGKAIAESSPSRPILDPDWKPSTPHEAPPTSGILALFNAGTRGKFYWKCPQCNEPFQPLFECLKWENRATPGESAKTVEIACLNGCVIGPDRKNEMNRDGFWLHETNAGELVEIDDPDIRDTDIASYWCEGPVAAMQKWSSLVLNFLQARDKLARTGDETDLKTTVNVDQGKAHLPQAQKNAEDGMSVDVLKALADQYPVGVAPADTRFMTVQVDIQGRSFVVQVDAWCEDLERFLIDRFEIVQPPELAPGGQRDKEGNARRAIDPAKYYEDWKVLPALLEKAYPVEGTDYALQPAAMIIDSGGAKGVTPNAYKFFRTHGLGDLKNRVFLAKGQGGIDLKFRTRYAAPETVQGKKTNAGTDIRLLFVATDRIKDEIINSLLRKDPGPGKYHLSENLPERVFSELCAEHRLPKKWERKKAGQANEAFDLAVYGKALALKFKADKIDWQKPPVWAAPIGENIYAVSVTDGKPDDKPVHKRTTKRSRVRSKGI